MAVFCSVNAKWVSLSIIYIFHCSFALAFNAWHTGGHCGQKSIPEILQARSGTAFEGMTNNDNKPRFATRSLPLKCPRRVASERSFLPSMSNSENAVWKNRGPFTLTKDTEWKLTLSLTGPPQDGQFGPGSSFSLFGALI